MTETTRQKAQERAYALPVDAEGNLLKDTERRLVVIMDSCKVSAYRSLKNFQREEAQKRGGFREPRLPREMPLVIDVTDRIDGSSGINYLQ